MKELDLAEYFITSKATKNKNNSAKEQMKIIVKKSEGVKCPRCWKILENKCDRCEKIIKNLS